MKTHKEKYHQYGAALLLAVYVFITTPVGLWHHHNHEKQGKVEKSDKLLLNSAKIGSAVEKCAICDHQYSILLNSYSTEFNFGIRPYITCLLAYLPAIIQRVVFHAPNKGPPTLV